MGTSKCLKPRRGSTSEHNTFRGEAFEITFDTDKKTIVAHDGLTMGGFPLAHEAAVAAVDSELRDLIDQKVSNLEGVSISELAALETALRGLINLNAQQQTARNNDQDAALANLNNALRAFIAAEVAKYLPLTGGTMMGNVRFAQSGDAVLYRGDNVNRLIVRGGSSNFEDGASWYLYGKDHPVCPGYIIGYAHDGTKNSSIELRPDGTFLHSGQYLVHSVNGKSAGADGSVRLWAESKNGINLDSLTEAGTYYVNGENLNIPSGTNGYLFVTGTTAASAIRQIFYRIGTVGVNEHNYYTRARDSAGAWGEWAKFLTDKDTIAASSASTATQTTTVPNFAVAAANGKKCSGGSISGNNWVLPSGGTWRYIKLYGVGTSNGAAGCGTAAGGSSLVLQETTGGANGNDYTYNYIAIRIS